MQSNFDRRRINGAEESFPPEFEDNAVAAKKPYSRSRPASEIRPIFLHPSLINQAGGSCYIETDKSKIACAVYGPRQTKNVAYSERGRLNVEVKFTPFSCTQRRAPLRDAEDRSIAMAIHQALSSSVRLELFPKSIIDVFVMVIEADGIESCVASGSVAASAALADAGIEVLGLVVSCSACIVKDEILLDPTEADVQASAGVMVLSCLPALEMVTSVWQTGRMKIDESLRCMALCQERCADVHSVVAQTLVENEVTQ